LDQFYSGGDAIVETLVNGQPSGQSPLTSSGSVVSVSSFDVNGNYTLSSTPSSFDVALLYILKIKAIDYGNIVKANELNREEEGVVKINATQTLTNKRITQRVTTITSSATPTPNANTDDLYKITALASAALLTNPTGTPTDGQALLIRIKDNGTARLLTFDTQYRFSTDQAAPTTTVLSKTIYLGFVWNSTDSKWDCLGWNTNI